MKLGTIAFLFMTILTFPFLPEARGGSEKDLGTGLSPFFKLDTLRGIAPEIPTGGIGCGISPSFYLDTLRGISGNLASGMSSYFSLDTRSSNVIVTPTPTPTDPLGPTPTSTEEATGVHDWRSY
jgi:hypothetical protein